MQPSDNETDPASGGDDDWLLLRAHLPADEEVLWTGRPIPAHAAWSGLPGSTHAARVGVLLLGLAAVAPLAAGGLYICWVAVTRFFGFDRIEVVLGAPLLFTFGLVVAVAPPYLLLRPRLHHAQLARETCYVLTDRRARALIVRDGAVVDEATADLSALHGADVRFPRPDGSGDVVLVPAAGISEPGSGAGAFAFVAVPEATAVQARVAEAIAARRGDVAAI